MLNQSHQLHHQEEIQDIVREGQYSRGRRIRKVTGDYDDTIAPYATLPQTGDKIGLYIFLACVSCILLVFILRKPSESLTSIEKRYKNKKQKEKLES